MSLEPSPGRADGWPMYLSVREVAFELGLSTRRIYQLAAAGELKLVKIGAVSRVTSASLLALAQRADAGDKIAEFVRSRPKATVGRKGAGLRGFPRKAPKGAKPAKPKDSSPPAPHDRRFKVVRKPRRRADRADAAEQQEQT